MCGIAAVFAYGGGRADERVVRCACQRHACRGPDGEGFWTSADARVHFGHRRLAIIDLSDAGAQPMASADGSVVISFNGEIYNYRALREKLLARGCRFRSDSDTEVMLHLYAEFGLDMFSELRGMFALALWDERKSRLVLARDPFGIKPLYIADDGRSISAASEVKALLAGADVDRSPEPAGHIGFFLWGHVPEPYTLYRGIRALPAGSILAVDHDGRHTLTRFADLGQLLRDADRAVARPDEDVSPAIHDALLDSVRHHLVADVPVGIFLSAGIDSAVLTSLAAESGATLRTVTLGFEEFKGTPNDETSWARIIADRYGTRHDTIWVTRSDFRDSLDHLLDRMDQPTIDGVNSYFVARAASSAGLKVALSGLGGDELFGGYPSFAEIPRWVGLASKVPAGRGIGRAFRKASSPFLGRLTSPKYAGVLEYGGTFARAYFLRRGLFMPWELHEFFDQDFVEAGLGALDYETIAGTELRDIKSPRLLVTGLEAGFYMRNQLLRDTDWASMSHSIEVRVPFVDWHLWQRTVSSLARDGSRKARLATAARPSLPAALTARAKTGFFTPVARWLDQELGSRSTERGLRGWARYVYAREIQA
jgi:asparagine synthase (glutamine-hydrolysing)